jgi:transposase
LGCSRCFNKSSKESLGIKTNYDVAFIMQTDHQRTQRCWKIFDNNEHGLHQMKTWLQNNQVPFTEDSLFVIENTGLYHRMPVNFCNRHQLQLCIENGAPVKWSFGIARGQK